MADPAPSVPVGQSSQRLLHDTVACDGKLYAAAYVDRDGTNCYAAILAEDRRDILTGPVLVARVAGNACITLAGEPTLCHGLDSTGIRFWSGQMILPHAGKRCDMSAFSHIELPAGCPEGASAFAFDTK